MKKVIFTTLLFFILPIVYGQLEFNTSEFDSFDIVVGADRSSDGRIIAYAVAGSSFLTIAFIIIIGGLLFYKYKYKSTTDTSRGITVFSKYK